MALITCLMMASPAAFAQSFDNNAYIKHVGEPRNADLQPIDGYGRGVAMVDALKQVTPKGWIVKLSDPAKRINLKEPVSWKGGRDWFNAVEQIAYQLDAKATIDWKRKEVTLAPLASGSRALYENSDDYRKPRSGMSSMREIDSRYDRGGYDDYRGNRYASNARDYDDYRYSGPRTKVYELEQDDQRYDRHDRGDRYDRYESRGSDRDFRDFERQQPWMLKSSKTLKENVQEWGRLAGFDVVWNASDYPIDADRTLYGGFTSEEGPLAQLAKDYGPQSRVKNPLNFQLYKNNTLVVDNLKYEQVGSTIDGSSK